MGTRRELARTGLQQPAVGTNRGRPTADIAHRNEGRGGPFGNSRVSRSTRGQPQHGTAEIVVLGEIAIDCNTVDLVVADDRLNELITTMRNVGNPASWLPVMFGHQTPEQLVPRQN